MKLWAGFEDWLSCYSKVLVIDTMNVSCSLIGFCKNSRTLHSYKYLYGVSFNRGMFLIIAVVSEMMWNIFSHREVFAMPEKH